MQVETARELQARIATEYQTFNPSGSTTTTGQGMEHAGTTSAKMHLSRPYIFRDLQQHRAVRLKDAETRSLFEETGVEHSR